MKLDHKFDKKEKERNKALRASQTCERGLKNNRKTKEAFVSKLTSKALEGKIDLKRSLFGNLPQNDDENAMPTDMENKLMEALAEVAADDASIE